MVDWSLPTEPDILHLGFLVVTATLVLSMAFAGIVTVGGTDRGDTPNEVTAPTPEQPDSEATEPEPAEKPTGIGTELDNETVDVDVQHALRNSDTVVWVGADSQPSTNADFERLNASVEDLAGLDVSPDLVLLPGDISDSYNAEDRERNIARARASLLELPWFGSSDSPPSVYVPGNHERESLAANERAFGTSCGADRLVEATAKNATLKVIGLCRAEGPGDPIRNRTLDALDARLATLSNSSANWTVVVTMHQPVPGTVSNCHTLDNPGIGKLGATATERYLNITRSHSDLVEMTITGHIHGRWSDLGRSIVRTRNQTFIDAPVFGGGTTYTGPEGPRCSKNGRGVGDSMFITADHGEGFATLHVRASCDDLDRNGKCNRGGYWRESVRIPLDRPISPR